MSLTAEQQAIRSTGIGGSEIAAVVGLSPWMKPIDVYLKKLGLADDKQTFHTQRGTFLEDGLRNWYAAKRKRRVLSQDTTFRSKVYPHVLATPDGIAGDDASGPLAALELKFPGWRTADAWGEAGTDQIPEYYLPQALFEAHVTGLPETDVAAFIDGDLHIYTVGRNDDAVAFLCDRAEAFWRDHIEKRVPPPVDGSDSYADYIKRMHPRSQGVLLETTPDVDAIATNLREARAKIDALEAHEAELANTLKAFIGDADGVETGLGKITWKSTKDSVRRDWEAIAAELKPSDDLLTKHTTIKPGHRTFLVPRSWKKEASK